MIRLVLALAIAPLVFAQSDAPVPKWEAVSIKPCPAGTPPGGRGAQGPGRLTLTCVPVEVLIHQSYLLFPNGVLDLRGAKAQVEHGPAWMYSDLYTVEAKAEDVPGQPAPGQGTMQGPMLRALLADRFKLQIHRAAGQAPVYALTVLKERPRLQAAPSGGCLVADLDHLPPVLQPGQPPLPLCGLPVQTNDRMEFYGATMAQICASLSLRTDRKVIDKTGIEGVFDIVLDWSGGNSPRVPLSLALPPPPPPPPPPGSGGPPAAGPDAGEMTAHIQGALRKIGLKLEAAQGPDDNLIVDHIERPGEN